MSERVDICDVYKNPSIKDLEHSRRSADEVAYSITGPNQQRPKDWHNALKSSAFKTAFLKFLAQEWSCHGDPAVLAGHHVYLAVEEVCHHHTVHEGSVVHEEVDELACTHLEADTRIVFHMSSMVLDSNSTVAVRSCDTHVFVLLLYHISRMSDDHKPLVWMDVGLSGNNTRRLINMSQLVYHFDQDILEALLALHAYTGSDYTASFIWRVCSTDSCYD